jgi:hypothetical protein
MIKPLGLAEIISHEIFDVVLEPHVITSFDEKTEPVGAGVGAGADPVGPCVGAGVGAGGAGEGIIVSVVIILRL